jgi:hypothetical protein
MSLTKDCEYCGNEFTAQRETAKYCCDSCKTLACRQRRVDEQVQAEAEETQNAILQNERARLELIEAEMERQLQLKKQAQEFQNQVLLERQHQEEIERLKKNEKDKVKRQIEHQKRMKKADNSAKLKGLVALGFIALVSKLVEEKR